MDRGGATASRGQRVGPRRGRIGGARFLVLVVALATLGLSASNGWSQDVFSAGGGSPEPGPSGGPSGSDQFSGPGVENTSVVRGSQQVLRRCKLRADYSDVICDDGFGQYGPALIASNPYHIPQPQANRLAAQHSAINNDPRVGIGNAYARARDLREYEAGPPKSAIGRQIKNITRTTQRGANRLPPPSKSSGARRIRNTTRATQRGANRLPPPSKSSGPAR
jgi:hypothetical protein